MCGYITGEEVRAACTRVVRQEPSLRSLPMEDEAAPVAEGTFTMHPRFVRVAGHLHSVTLPRCPIELLPVLRKMVLQAVKKLVDQAAHDAIINNGDLTAAMQRHGLQAEDVVLQPNDCVVLFEA